MRTRTQNGRAAMRRQYGAVVVELALAIPVLLMLILGVAELGRVMVQYNAMYQANREAARYLAANAIADSTQVINISNAVRTNTRNLAVYSRTNVDRLPILKGLNVNDVTIRVIDPLHVSVDMRYRYRPGFVTSIPTFGFGDPINMGIDLRTAIVMRVL
jgi:hypothetical protein